ncbi:MAG TPA: pyrimidine utilization protein D [Allosphingosinicella sp.]|nr:pyrimidine utilization protein D [Allosphingosinicella sp.]
MPHIAGLYYEEHGPAHGPPLILSAGLGGSASYWAPNLSALAESHRVVLYDHRGTGRSDRDLPFNLSVEDMAADVLALMDGLGIGTATLVGHAAGGAIGLSLALAAPDRLDRLVVVNGFAKPDSHFLRCFDTRLALLRDCGVRAFLHAQPIFLYPARWISENEARLGAEEAQQLEHFQGAPNIEARIAALVAFDVGSRLAEIRTPTLLIAADDDMLVPASCSEALAEGLPGAKLAMMTGGHACTVTQSARFNHLLRDWLGHARLKGAA